MTQTIQFSKMQGAGNDFMVIDAIRQPVQLSAVQIQQLAHRQFGIGFDQLLLVEASEVADFKYRIFNADGGEVAQCGNGARCFVKFVVEEHLTKKHDIRVETLSGIIAPTLESNGTVTVDMGAPIFAPADIPFLSPHTALQYEILVKEKQVVIAALSMGNPHAVIVTGDVETAPVETLGRDIEHHPQFPERVNVGFMQIMSPQHIKLRVFERGSGETLACGTGACAATVAGIQSGLLQSPVRVSARGGDLTISWAGNHTPVMMTGPAVTVYKGEITL